MIARSALAALAALLACVQLANLALFGSVAAAPSLPHLLAGTWPFATAHALGLDRLPPVRIELARAALLRNDIAQARMLLPADADDTSARDLRAQIAAAAGNDDAAMRDYGAAGDIVRADTILDAVGAHDPRAALALARIFESAATLDRAPPVAAFLAYREGVLAAAAADTYPREANADRHAALAYFERAVAADPTQEGYGLSLGFSALRAGDAARAQAAYAAVAARDPRSVDAFTGLAYSAAARGDCDAARAAMAQARAINATASRGYRLIPQAPLARCLSGG